MPIGAIALIIDGIMTAAVGAVLLHKLQSTAAHVNEEIDKGVKDIIANAPEILASAMRGDDARQDQS